MRELRFDPYCGPAPAPAEIWTAWNLDPWLLAAALAAWAFCRATSSAGGPTGASPGYAGLALAVLVAAFVSPLCALSSALFSARVLHHILLVAVAAPLLALAFPARRGMGGLPMAALVVGHMAAMWVWHAPGPYAFALTSHAAYWLMEATLFITAFLMWQAILAPGRHTGAALAALLATVAQMGMLGALITFAARPVFEPHAVTTLAFGLTPLADQQLAGLMMWVPGCLPYLGAAILLSARLLAPAGDASRGGAR